MFSALYEFDMGNYNYQNPGSNILSVTSQATGDFDKVNLTTDILRQTWRSSAIDDWQEIVIEGELSSNIDTIGILNHNLTESAIIIVQANTTNSFLVPPVNITIPWQKQNLVHCNQLGGSYRYYKIKILDPTNPCGYIEIGRIVGGRALIMVNSEDIKDQFTIGKRDMAKVMESEGFFRAYNEMVKARTISASFGKLSTVPGLDTNFLALRDLYDTVGISRPFLAIVDRDDPSFCSIWGLLSEIPSEEYDINRYVTQSIKINEVF